MNWQRILRIIKLGLLNFWRNRWLSLAATLNMALTLLVISTFAISAITIKKTADTIREKIDITIYIKDSASVDDIVSLQRKLGDRPDVKTVKYISKEEALEVFKTQQKGKKVSEYITGADNPLPRSLEIKANKAEDLDNIATFIQQDQYSPMIENVSYQENKKIIERLIGLTKFTNEIGILLSLTFLITSILVILNTIRLTIFNRKDEIEIMCLVGANDQFIKIPFLIEGALYGIFAALIAFTMIGLGLSFVISRAWQELDPSLGAAINRFFTSNLWSVIGLEIILGVAISVSCSFVSIRKHLKI